MITLCFRALSARIPLSRRGPAGETAHARRRRRNPPGNAQAPERQEPANSGERPARAHRRGEEPARPVPNLSGFRTEGRRAGGPPFFFWPADSGNSDGTTDTAL